MPNYDLAKSVKVRDDLKCPGCGLILNGAAGMVEKGEVGVPTPNPGDYTVCIECGHMLVFTDDLGLRELTEEEKTYMADDDRILLAQNAIRRMNRDKKMTLKKALSGRTVEVRKK